MRTSWVDGGTHLVRSVSWTDRDRPALVTSDLTEAVHRIALPGATLAFTVEPGRHCTGRSVLTPQGTVRTEACARRRVVESGRQCSECAMADEFRPIHQVHRGGPAGEALRRYLDRPHWLYVATFADGAPKVGTASDHHKVARLDEQGAVRATYLARCADGLEVRRHEDAVTAGLGVPQTRTARRKAAALASPLPAARLDAVHAELVDRACHLLASRGLDPAPEPWVPPALHGPVLGEDRAAGAPFAGHAPLPHDLTTGAHRLTVEALVGATALVRVNDEKGGYLADLTRLVGRKLVPGPVDSPAVAHQDSLF
ncbi:DUF2797 domain-containing protein [Kytococcus schroeteri]|uniref:DUF2797 domain-containing protein n=1 Tax=Kytococcus schroeteri TaxID=138300 RepID=UPI001143DBE3|nr:DUF2797 domain-containing protein [Kytococcus schroeteri]